MNQIRIIAIGIILFLVTYSYSGIDLKHIGNGAGGQVSFVASGNHGGAFGFGFHGIIEMSLGKIGVIQYNPSLCFWFNSSTDNPNPETEIEYRNRQTSLNLFDAKYILPLFESIFIVPYAGCGLCILIDGWVKQTKVTGLNPTKISEKDGYPGFNLFCGLNFPVKKTFIPFVETRFTATKNWSFKFTGGTTFHF